MLLVVLYAMISPVSSHLQLTFTQQRQFHQHPQPFTASRSHLRPALHPVRLSRRVATTIPAGWHHPQPPAPVMKLPSTRVTSSSQRLRMDRDTDDNSVMDNEDSILAGNMSPELIKGMADYIYGLIIGKYEPKQHQRPVHSTNEVVEAVFDYEDETRAMDARNGVPMRTANVMRMPSRSQPSWSRRAPSRLSQTTSQRLSSAVASISPRAMQQRPRVPMQNSGSTSLAPLQPWPQEEQIRSRMAQEFPRSRTPSPVLFPRAQQAQRRLQFPEASLMPSRTTTEAQQTVSDIQTGSQNTAATNRRRNVRWRRISRRKPLNSVPSNFPKRRGEGRLRRSSGRI
ncbi:hypothetical protein GCK32_015916 [Trichostrongylus colubriformis]|uniref:Uncharacterized protein n=1 Tax=Trichostrongylus colubriformis TaxID=6319 RepID=A0AAN8FU18_TRICO